MTVCCDICDYILERLSDEDEVVIGEDEVKVEGRENCLEAKEEEVKDEKDVEVRDIESVSVIFGYNNVELL